MLRWRRLAVSVTVRSSHERASQRLWADLLLARTVLLERALDGHGPRRAFERTVERVVGREEVGRIATGLHLKEASVRVQHAVQLGRQLRAEGSVMLGGFVAVLALRQVETPAVAAWTFSQRMAEAEPADHTDPAYTRVHTRGGCVL